MNLRIIIYILFVAFLLSGHGNVKAENVENTGGNYTVRGYIKDESGEELIGASIYVKDKYIGVATNFYGFYSLSLPPGKYTLVYSYIGYNPQEKAINLKENIVIDVTLTPATEEIEAVEIRAERKDANVRQIEMGVNKMQMKTIEKIPVFMGETDIIKSIQLLPGVQVGGEGSTGFYVRGGGVDQNLILLDEATVYNPAHSGGIFSVFNGDAIKNVELFKGSIPSTYGGRLSSVLDVRMKEGNTQKIGVNGGIGTVSSRLTVEGPILDEKMSFIVSGRRTYLDVFFPMIAKITDDNALKETKFYFYDLTAKINYKLNENNRFFISTYGGRDVNAFGDLFQMNFGNKTFTGRWNHVFTPKLFSNFTYVYSNFDYNLGQETGPFAFDWNAYVIDHSLKNDYIWYLNPRNTLKFGWQSTYHTFIPAEVEAPDSSNLNSFKLPRSYALENGVFIQNEQEVNSRLSVMYGLRFSNYLNYGGIEYKYDNMYNQIDSINHKRGDIYNIENNIEPRLGVRYLLSSSLSLKAGYTRTAQYVLLGSNTASVTPLDIWYTCNTNIKPMKGDQVSIGLFKNFKNDMYKTSIEGYYKKMYDSPDFIDHAQVFLNDQFDTIIRSGNAYSYGLEFYVEKQTGKFTGWISYTLSKTRRKIPGINGGEEYSAPYDRPHDLKIVAMYDITKRINIAANWVFMSSLPYTLATSFYPYEGVNVPIYSKRNEMRLKEATYHRLDLSATIHFKPMLNVVENNLTLSIYNVYNRHNLYSVLYQDLLPEPIGNGIPEMYKFYLYGFMPALTWNFKF